MAQAGAELFDTVSRIVVPAPCGPSRDELLREEAKIRDYHDRIMKALED